MLATIIVIWLALMVVGGIAKAVSKSHKNGVIRDAEYDRIMQQRRDQGRW